MARNRIAKLSSIAWYNILYKFGSVECRICHKELEIGSNYVTKKSARSSSAKRYCLNCAKQKLII